MFFLPYLAVSSKVRYFHDNDTSGRKINIFIIFARINTQFLDGSPKSQELSNIYTF